MRKIFFLPNTKNIPSRPPNPVWTPIRMKKFSSYQKRCSQHPGKLEFSLYLTQISCGWTIPFVCRSFPSYQRKCRCSQYPDKLLFFTLYITQISSGWTIPFVCRSFSSYQRKCRYSSIQTNWNFHFI